MAWTQPPRTWTDGELVTAAIMNAHVRDQLLETWHKIARKTADESVASSTALQDDDHLQITVGTTDIWHFDARLIVNGSTGDLKVSWSIPASGALGMAVADLNDTGTTANQHSFLTATDGATISVFGDVTTPGVPIVFHCYYIGGGTAGTVKLRWAQQSSVASPTTLRAGSSLIGMKVA